MSRTPLTRIGRTGPRRSAALALAVVLGTAAGAAGAPPAADAALPRFDAPVAVDEGAPAAGAELSLAVDPTDPQRQLTCYPSGVGTGGSPVARSDDGGQHWSPVTVPDSSAGRTLEGGDCDVAFDRDGTAYLADVSGVQGTVRVSRDGGRTWPDAPASFPVPVADRPWLLPGDRAGHLRLVYQDVQFVMPSAVWSTESDDHGRTWSAPVLVTSAADTGGSFTWLGAPVAGEDGRLLLVPYARRVNPNLATDRSVETGPEAVHVARSTDGGRSWTDTVVATVPRAVASIYPAIALGPEGEVHLVWSAPRGADTPVWYAHSADGRTWSSPQPVVEGRTAWAPSVLVDRAGRVLVGFVGSDTPRGTDDVDAVLDVDPTDPTSSLDRVVEQLYGGPRPSGLRPYVAVLQRTEGGRVVARTGPTTDDVLWEGRGTPPEFVQLREGPTGLSFAFVVGDQRAQDHYVQRESVVPGG